MATVLEGMGSGAVKRDEGRDKIIKENSGYARMLAARLFANRHIREIEFDDFLQYAMVGLIEAVDRYKPEHGATFQTYAHTRITGAILNGIEKCCERQQQISLRSRLRKERAKSIADISDKTSTGTLFEHLMETAIGLSVGFMLEDSGMYQGEEHRVTQGEYEKIEFAQLCKVLRHLVELLPEQKKYVVKYHYFHGHKFDEIADLLDLTKGRVSQIHKQAVEELRVLYQNYRELNQII